MLIGNGEHWTPGPKLDQEGGCNLTMGCDSGVDKDGCTCGGMWLRNFCGASLNPPTCGNPPISSNVSNIGGNEVYLTFTKSLGEDLQASLAILQLECMYKGVVFSSSLTFVAKISLVRLCDMAGALFISISVPLVGGRPEHGWWTQAEGVLAIFWAKKPVMSNFPASLTPPVPENRVGSRKLHFSLPNGSTLSM